MEIIIGLIAFIFVLGVIIAVHEGGHFYFARRADILCREFAFGMGPQLWKKKKGETVYSIRAFPIGGFCAIAGEEVEDNPFKDLTKVKLDVKNGFIKGFYLNVADESINLPVYEIISYDIFDENQTGNLYMEVSNGKESFKYSVDSQAIIYDRKLEYQIAPHNRTIGAKSKRARAMVMFGGPLMNFLLALVVFFIAGLLQGFPNEESSQLSGLTEDQPTPAYLAGLQNDDIIINLTSGNLAVDVDEWQDISLFMSSYTEQGLITPIDITYTRAGEVKNTSVNPQVVFYSSGIVGVFNPTGIKIIELAETNDAMANNSALEIGDIITNVEGNSYLELGNIYKVFENYEGNKENEELNVINMTVTRNGESKEVKIQPYSKSIMETQTTTSGDPIPAVKVAMGVSPAYKFSLMQSFAYSGKRTVGSFTAIYDTFNLLFNEKTVTIAALSGPVGIYQMTSAMATQGFANILNWMGLLSVNVGLLNLLPIPALDGGRLVFLGYEAVTKKKPNPKVETAMITVTMLLLFGLMIYVTFNDILRLFK